MTEGLPITDEQREAMKDAAASYLRIADTGAQEMVVAIMSAAQSIGKTRTDSVVVAMVALAIRIDTIEAKIAKIEERAP